MNKFGKAVMWVFAGLILVACVFCILFPNWHTKYERINYDAIYMEGK